MNARFRELVETLGAKHRELLELPIVTASDIPSSTPTGGVYLFSEGENTSTQAAPSGVFMYASAPSSAQIQVRRLFRG